MFDKRWLVFRVGVVWDGIGCRGASNVLVMSSHYLLP
jgi:hypothetical protein